MPGITLGPKKTKMNVSGHKIPTGRAQGSMTGADRCCRDRSVGLQQSLGCDLPGPVLGLPDSGEAQTWSWGTFSSWVLLEPANSHCSPPLYSSIKLWFSDFIFKPQPPPLQETKTERHLQERMALLSLSNIISGSGKISPSPSRLPWVPSWQALAKGEKVFA